MRKKGREKGEEIMVHKILPHLYINRLCYCNHARCAIQTAPIYIRTMRKDQGIFSSSFFNTASEHHSLAKPLRDDEEDGSEA